MGHLRSRDQGRGASVQSPPPAAQGNLRLGASASSHPFDLFQRCLAVGGGGAWGDWGMGPRLGSVRPVLGLAVHVRSNTEHPHAWMGSLPTGEEPTPHTRTRPTPSRRRKTRARTWSWRRRRRVGGRRRRRLHDVRATLDLPARDQFVCSVALKSPRLARRGRGEREKTCSCYSEVSQCSSTCGTDKEGGRGICGPFGRWIEQMDAGSRRGRWDDKEAFADTRTQTSTSC